MSLLRNPKTGRFLKGLTPFYKGKHLPIEHKAHIREALAKIYPSALLSKEERRLHNNKVKRDYYHSHKESFKSRVSNWRKRNKDKVNSYHRKTNRKLKIKVLGHYGELKCKSCGTEDISSLELDHINEDGGIHRKQIKGSFYNYLKKNNYPNNPPLQILCNTCNFRKQLAFRKSQGASYAGGLYYDRWKDAWLPR